MKWRCFDVLCGLKLTANRANSPISRRLELQLAERQQLQRKRERIKFNRRASIKNLLFIYSLLLR